MGFVKVDGKTAIVREHMSNRLLEFFQSPEMT